MFAASSSGDLVSSSIDIVKAYAGKLFIKTFNGESDKLHKRIDKIRQLNLDKESIDYLKKELISIFSHGWAVTVLYPDMKYDELISLYDELDSRLAKMDGNNDFINNSNVDEIISKSFISDDIVKINECLDYLNTKFHSSSEKIFNYNYAENKIYVTINYIKKSNFNDLIIKHIDKLIKLEVQIDIELELNHQSEINSQSDSIHFSEFLAQVGKKITYISSNFFIKLDQNYILALSKNCPNLKYISLNLCPELKNTDLAEILTIKSLDSLEINRCLNITGIPDLKSSSDLKNLSISLCPNFKLDFDINKFPILEYFGLKDCVGVDEDSRKAFIIKLFEQRPKLALSSYNDLFNDDQNSIDYLIKEIPPSLVYLHLSEIIDRIIIPNCKKITESQKSQLLNYLYKLDPGSFKELGEKFASVRDDFPLFYFEMPQLISRQLSLSQVIRKPATQEELVFEELPQVDIDTILSLFDCINFDRKDRLGYIDPLTLTADGVSIKIEDVKNGMGALLERIHQNTPYLGVPTDPEENKKWYLYLENALKHLIFEIEKQVEDSDENNVMVSRFLIDIGIAALFCGTRWRNTVLEAYKEISGKTSSHIIDGSVENALDKIIDSYKKALIIEAVTKSSYGSSSHPHTFNFFVKSLLDTGVTLSSKIIEEADFADPLLVNYTDPAHEVYKGFIQRVTVYGLFTVIKEFLEEEFQKGSLLSSDCVECLKAFAEERMIPQETLGHSKKHGILVDLLIENELIIEDFDEDTLMMSRKITPLGVLALMEHFGYIERYVAVDSESPPPPSSSSGQ